MNGLKNFLEPRRRGGWLALAVTSFAALLVIAAAATGGGSASVKGVHGTSVAYVKILPKQRTLQQGVVSTIRITSKLEFVVAVKNGGDYPERNIKVTLLIKQNPRPIRKTLTIGKIPRGAYKEVVFKRLFNVTEFINRIPLKVIVSPVSGETQLTNNSASYEVRFTF
jgi:hypothetical protein